MRKLAIIAAATLLASTAALAQSQATDKKPDAKATTGAQTSGSAGGKTPIANGAQPGAPNASENKAVGGTNSSSSNIGAAQSNGK